MWPTVKVKILNLNEPTYLFYQKASSSDSNHVFFSYHTQPNCNSFITPITDKRLIQKCVSASFILKVSPDVVYFKTLTWRWRHEERDWVCCFTLFIQSQHLRWVCQWLINWWLFWLIVLADVHVHEWIKYPVQFTLFWCQMNFGNLSLVLFFTFIGQNNELIREKRDTCIINEQNYLLSVR